MAARSHPRSSVATWRGAAAAGALLAWACTPPPVDFSRPVACSNVPAEEVPSEGWAHVDEGTPLEYAHNPPASGPHYPSWGRYGVHATVLERPYWVHNVEHGAVVLLYRPDAPADAVDELRAAYDDIPLDPTCLHRRTVLTADPLLDVPVAAVTALRVKKGDRLARAEVVTFARACRGHAPEDVCTDGSQGD
ncbi:MAG: DUF3105 domain-containing protein [Deltaproteobacteria bacterium]|nr:DUF3105 domain-containing protein [Deltaproteobacteria bacterium]